MNRLNNFLLLSSVVCISAILTSCSSNKGTETVSTGTASIQKSSLSSDSLLEQNVSKYCDKLKNNQSLSASEYKEIVDYSAENCDGEYTERIGNALYSHFYDNGKANEVILSLSDNERQIMLLNMMDLMSIDLLSDNDSYSDLKKHFLMYSENKNLEQHFNELKKNSL